MIVIIGTTMKVMLHHKMISSFAKIIDCEDLLQPCELEQISMHAYKRYFEPLFNSLSVNSLPLLSAIWPQLCSFRINSVSLVILPPSTVQVRIVTLLLGFDSGNINNTQNLIYHKLLLLPFNISYSKILVFQKIKKISN